MSAALTARFSRWIATEFGGNAARERCLNGHADLLRERIDGRAGQ